jgi:CRISPR-associated endonuclease Cas1
MAAAKMLLETYHEDNPQHGEAWRDRSALWREQVLQLAPKPPRFRRAERKPLVLTGHGVSLRIDNGALLIRGGRTHYPQEIEEYRFFPGSRDRPSRVIVLDGSGAITFDVLDWLSVQNIPLIRIDWQGRVIAIGSSNGYGASRTKVAEQRKAVETGRSLDIASSLIGRKIENSIETLSNAVSPSAMREKALSVHGEVASTLAKSHAASISELLGLEGKAAYTYFQAWQGIRIEWSGTGRRPIPKEWRTIGPRSSNRTNKLGSNKLANHPVNAMLNYAYAILEAQVRIQIAVDGYDPMISYLHASSPERPGLIFDFMEPKRPIVDRAVLRFVQANTFKPGDFTLRSDGVCRLNPELARRVVGLVMEGM